MGRLIHYSGECVGNGLVAAEHAGQALVQHDSEGPDVGGLVDRFAARLLGEKSRSPLDESPPSGSWQRGPGDGSVLVNAVP
jgi:hypothetical protein